jgi:ankyrin repeat protein
MRNGAERDEVAQRHSALCFEMEAAGMMDNAQCLPIRGISDYSDSHKSKAWQEYAAATAAAYARELLQVIPFSSGAELSRAHTTRFDLAHEVDTSGNTQPPFPDGRLNMLTWSWAANQAERRRLLLESLNFAQIDARKTTIRTAHTKTCRWFLQHPAYRDWLDPEMQSQNHGFLWMRGKAGAGKSTMMKFVYLEAKKKSRPNNMTASFFFNARGHYLEKSIIGMYRSLLLQLLKKFRDLQSILDDADIIPSGQQGCPDLDALKELLRSAVMALDQRSFTCFIDALDECDEQEVRDMVQFFEELAAETTEAGIQLRICFSSRPYPYISIRKGISLTLEDESGHAEDLAQYVKSNLKIEDPGLLNDLQSEILGKASGIFLWIVLTVDILNKEDDDGGLALRTKLSKIPDKLSDLFKSILLRDQKNPERLLLCVLWILCSRRPLTLEEFRHALWVALLDHKSEHPECQVDPDVPDVRNTIACVRLVTSSSKGLAEATKSEDTGAAPSVQFVHESVRDFLVKEKGLQQLWPELGFDWEGLTHERLRRCCSLYLSLSGLHTTHKLPFGRDVRNTIARTYSLFEYATQQILYHADAAALVTPQDNFLTEFFDSDGVQVVGMFGGPSPTRQYTRYATPLYVLADKGLENLVRILMKQESVRQRSHDYIRGEEYHYPLFVALANRHKGTVAAILGLPSTTCDGVDITEGLKYKKDMASCKGRTPLSWAAHEGRLPIVKALVEGGMKLNQEDSKGELPLPLGLEAGHEAIVRFLIANGANVNKGSGAAWTPLALAVRNRHMAIARLLIENGTDLTSNWRVLVEASEIGDEEFVRLLIEKGIDVPLIGGRALGPASKAGHAGIVALLLENGAGLDDNVGHYALSLASKNGHEDVVRLLVNAGARLTTPAGNELIHASKNGHKHIVQLLIESGVDVDAVGHAGYTALMDASQNGHSEITRLLIESGADVNTAVNGRYTALMYASMKGHSEIAALLVDAGASLDACDYRLTPLVWAARGGHEAIVRMLINKGADVNTGESWADTALTLAAKEGSDAMVLLLINAGADVNKPNSGGLAPLALASSYGHETVVQLLLRAGRGDIEIDAQDKEGQTALMWASRRGHDGVVQSLLEAGANVNAQAHDGDTALIEALRWGYTSVVQLLLGREVDVNAVTCDKKDSALIVASRCGSEATVRLLVDAGADVSAVNVSGMTARMTASVRGHEAIEQFLKGVEEEK